MTNISKNLLVFIFGFLLGVLVIVLTQSIFAITTEEISAWKESDKESTGAYKQELFNGTYEVHVYETPKREYGYQIIEYKGENIYSTGYGAEAENRTWTKLAPEVYIDMATSTDKQDEKII